MMFAECGDLRSVSPARAAVGALEDAGEQFMLEKYPANAMGVFKKVRSMTESVAEERAKRCW